MLRYLPSVCFRVDFKKILRSHALTKSSEEYLVVEGLVFVQKRKRMLLHLEIIVAK